MPVHFFLPPLCLVFVQCCKHSFLRTLALLRLILNERIHYTPPLATKLLFYCYYEPSGIVKHTYGNWQWQLKPYQEYVWQPQVPRGFWDFQLGKYPEQPARTSPIYKNTTCHWTNFCLSRPPVNDHCYGWEKNSWSLPAEVIRTKFWADTKFIQLFFEEETEAVADAFIKLRTLVVKDSHIPILPPKGKLLKSFFPPFSLLPNLLRHTPSFFLNKRKVLLSRETVQ